MATVWDAHTFCTYDDLVPTRIRESALLNTFLVVSDEAQARAIVDQLIVDVRDDILKPRVLKYLEEKYPGKSDEVLLFRNRLIQRAQQQRARQRVLSGESSIVPPPGNTIGELDNTVDGIPDVKPRVFTVDGAPTNGTSGTEAGNAENGDFLIDTDNDAIYINRGSTASPTWAAWTVKGLLDLIPTTNIKVLKRAFQDAVIWQIYALSESDGSQGDHFDRLDLIGKKVPEKKKIFEESLALALPQLEPDLSGDGVISTWEQADNGDLEFFY